MSLKRVGLLGLSVVLIFCVLVIYFKRILIASRFYGLTDFYTFYASVMFHFSGQNIYSKIILLKSKHGIMKSASGHANLNPPFFVLLLLPLHFFNYAHAFQIFSVISLVCMVVGGMLVFRAFPQWHKNTLPLMALFLLYAPMSETLAYGQVTSLLLVLLAGAWLLARDPSAQHDHWVGVLIGLACGIKLFCGLFLVYFFVMKRYRCVGYALAFLIAISVISGFIFGFQSYITYHETLSHIKWYAETWNDSFYGFFLRLFSNAEKNQPIIIAPYLVPLFTGMASVGLLGALWRKWKKSDVDVGFSLVIVAMLLLSPLGWGYYMPLLLIPYLVVIEKGTPWDHLRACFLLFISMQTGDLIRPPHLKTVSQVLIAGGLGFYVLIGMLFLVFYSDRHRSENAARLVISENLWILIYAVVFIPSVMSLGYVVKGLYALQH